MVRLKAFSLAFAFAASTVAAQEADGEMAIILPSGSYQVLGGQVEHGPDGVVLKGATIRIPLGYVVTLPNGASAAVPNIQEDAEPPLTSSERAAMALSVQRCWNVGELSSDALRVAVAVSIEMNRDATPVADSIRLVRHSGESELLARQAFDTARRAIIRCGVNGFDLPAEKYGQWREIEMTFDPSNMRIK